MWIGQEVIPIAGLGKAYVEVHADTRPFARELVTEIEVILAAAEKNLRASSRRLGESIGEKIGEGVRAKGAGISKGLKETLEKNKPKVDVDIDVDRSGFRRFLNNARTGLLNFGTSVKDSFSKVFSGLKTFVANIFNIPEASPLTSVLTVLAIAVLPALIPLVIGLAAAVADLAGFLALVPPGLSALIAVIPPLVIGFKAVAQAVEVAFLKDPKKFREALEGMSPVMQRLVKIIHKFAPAIEDIGRRIETAFITPLTRVLAPVLERLIPLFGRGLEAVSAALGRQLGRFADFLGSPTFEDFLTKLFPAVVRMIDRLGPALVRVFDALTQASTAALPFLERFVDGFADLLDRFSAWVERVAASGELDKFLDDAFKSLKDIAELAGAILELFHTWFTEADDEGRTMLDVFTELFKQFADFFASEKGKQLLSDLSDLAILFADNLKFILPLLAALATGFFLVSRIVNEIIAAVRVLIELIRRLLGLTSSLAGVRGTVGAIANSVFGPEKGGSKISKFAEGGITRGPSIAGEAGPELIIPLTKPNRAAALLADAGLLGPMSVYVFLGTNQITDILDTRVERAMNNQARALVNGPRSS